MILERVISGGQTGVDRAALDAALAYGLHCGGWCPKGRRADDGAIPARYPLEETPSADYRDRTERNVRGSDGTLVLSRGAPRGGTALTLRLARRHRKPCLHLDLATHPSPEAARAWIEREAIRVLNVAGSRENEAPEIYDEARRFLRAVLRPSG